MQGAAKADVSIQSKSGYINWAAAKKIDVSAPDRRYSSHQLLNAVAIPVLASQLRNLDPSFARSQSHAQQTAFAAECIAAGNKSGVDEEAMLTLFALQRWSDRHSSLLRPPERR